MQQVKNIWLGNWFNSFSNIIDVFEKNASIKLKYQLFVTYRAEYSPLFMSASQWEQEPSLSGQEYIDYCLDFCRRHSIDLFIPRMSIPEIIAAAKAFTDIGVDLFLCTKDAETYVTLNDKAAVYKRCEEKKIGIIPEWKTFSSQNEFETAYSYIKGSGFQACIKPVSSINGIGFRIITDDMLSQELLFSPRPYCISLEQIRAAFANSGDFPATMISEYLPGMEYSIDCVAHEGKLITTAVRCKESVRVERIIINPALLEIARQLAHEFRLSHIFNFQMRTGQDGAMKLLEINPRMSGGMWMSLLGNINLLEIALDYHYGLKPAATPENINMAIIKTDCAIRLNEAE